MPPRARSLRDHLAEGSFRGRYAHLLAEEPLDEAPPAAYAMIDSRVGPIWHRLVELQNAYCFAPSSPAALALGVENFRAAVLREFGLAARELHQIVRVLLEPAARR